MARFTVRFFLLTVILFFGVLLGMQYANDGMKQMKGYEDPDLKNAFTIQNGNGNEKEASVLGHEVSTNDLEKKQKELEEVEAFNVVSRTGKAISDGITNAAQSLYALIAEKIAGE
jgi:hypothetical protein